MTRSLDSMTTTAGALTVGDVVLGSTIGDLDDVVGLRRNDRAAVEVELAAIMSWLREDL